MKTPRGVSADRLIRALERQTRFGVGASFKDPREHAVLDMDWSVSPVTARLRDKGRFFAGRIPDHRERRP